MYEEAAAGKYKDKIITVNYKNLCENPEGVLKDISSRVEDLYGYKIEQLMDGPASFEFNSYDRADDDESGELRKGMETYFKN